jgi:adenylate cyclase
MFLEAGMREEAVAEISRVLGEALARVAATTAAAFAESFLNPGDSEDAVARRFAELTRQMAPALGPVLTAAFEAQLRDNVRRAAVRQTDLESGQIAGEFEAAVCFADLVGFTRLGGEVDPEQLGGVVGRFAELSADAAQDPVRLVKTIGDAAMLISREPGPLVEAALQLLEAVEEADLPPVRAGVAWGVVVPRSGDLFGHAVNLASRVTGIARPSSVLCDKAIRDATREQFDWSFAGRHRLKGVGDAVPLYRARRLTAEPEGGQDVARRPTADRRRRRASS